MTNVTRRQFILATGAAASAAWLAVPQGGIADQKASVARFGGFRVGLQSNMLNAFSPEMEPMVKHVAALGLHWIEFAHWHYNVTEDAERIAEVQALLERHAIRMEAYFLGEIEADAAQLRRTFRFARSNGVSVLVGQPTAEAFPILDALVKEFEIRVAVHNYGPGHRFDRIEDILKAVEPWDQRIGYCLDTGHAMRSGEPPVEAVRRMGRRLHGLHLREQAAIRRDPQPPEAIIGEGGLDLKALCRALRDAGFSGPLTLEMYYRPKEPLESLKRSLENLAEAAQATA
jgi:inosose dehydratase